MYVTIFMGDLMKVLFHIDEMEKWNLLNANLRNILEKDSNLSVSVVSNADSVAYFMSEECTLDEHIKYHVCLNSLKQRGYDRKEINNQVVIVDSGVYEIALLQSLGYSYIKP